MSNPKPWHGTFAPWHADAHAPYVDAVRRYPSLAAYVVAVPLKKKLRYHLQQRYKQVTETMSWGFSERRDRILRYEERMTAQ
jgi:hypothetical protein